VELGIPQNPNFGSWLKYLTGGPYKNIIGRYEE